jgi:hypothetical protein
MPEESLVEVIMEVVPGTRRAHDIKRSKAEHVYLRAPVEASRLQANADPSWVEALKTKLSHARGFVLLGGLLVEEHARRRKRHTKCRWRFYNWDWSMHVRPYYNPLVANREAVSSLVRPMLPEWITLDPSDGLALVSLSCKFEYELQTREWLATYLESIDSELARLWKKLPSMLSSESERAAPGGFVPNPVHVALYRSQLWRKTFVILDDIVDSVDEKLTARMEVMALDLREAILKRHAAIAQSAMEEEALYKELTLIRATRAAHR